MKETFAIIGAVLALAYLFFQALLTLLQPLSDALSSHLH